jgi:hypothetical protein
VGVAELSEIGIDSASGLELRHGKSEGDATVFLSHVKASFSPLVAIRIKELLKSEDTESIILFADGKFVGGLLFAAHLEISCAQLCVICVVCAHRGEGHGTRLMNALKRELCQRTPGKSLIVIAESPDACDGFFEWEGFYRLKPKDYLGKWKRKLWKMENTNPLRGFQLTPETPVIVFREEAQRVAAKKLQRLFDEKCSKKAQFMAIVRQAVDAANKEQTFAAFLSRKPSLGTIEHVSSADIKPVRGVRALLRQLHLPHICEALRLQIAVMIFCVFVLLILAYFLGGD